MALVRSSAVIDAPVEAVWALLRDFRRHAAWDDAVAEAVATDEEPTDRIGAVRTLRLADGALVSEQLIGLSDATRTLVSCLLESPIALMGYVATTTLKPVTLDDTTLCIWESRFEPPPAREAALRRFVAEQVHRAGFAALRARLGRPRRDPPPVGAASAPLGAPTPVHLGVSPAGSLTCEAIMVERYGGPEELRLTQVAVPPPGPGEVRLRQTAIGVNFIDVYCRTGYFDLLQPPAIPGMEAAGVILDVGAGVRHLRPGDRVAYACPPVGAYAGLRCMAAALLVPLPPDIDDETAAAVLLKGLSAAFLLHRVHAVRPGDTILVHAAAGGVGLLLCQWASALGAIVIGTVSGDDKAAAARRCGCQHVIVYTREDFVAAVLDITRGRGVDIVYDAVGHDTFARSFAALATCGHLVSFGQASGPLDAFGIDRLTTKSATVSRPNYAHYTDTPEKLLPMAGRLFAALRDGTLRVTIGQRLALAQAAEAHRLLESRATIGSTILLPAGGDARPQGLAGA